MAKKTAKAAGRHRGNMRTMAMGQMTKRPVGEKRPESSVVASPPMKEGSNYSYLISVNLTHRLSHAPGKVVGTYRIPVFTDDPINTQERYDKVAQLAEWRAAVQIWGEEDTQNRLEEAMENHYTLELSGISLFHNSNQA
jgi:hypothetical protein